MGIEYFYQFLRGIGDAVNLLTQLSGLKYLRHDMV